MALPVVALLLSAPAFHASAPVLSRAHQSAVVAQRSRAVQMVDQNILVGGAVAVLGSIGGVALVAFTENMGERTNARGGLSSEQATKMAGKYLEDVEADMSGSIDDVVAKMEAALSEGTEEKKEETAAVKEEEKKPATDSDGW